MHSIVIRIRFSDTEQPPVGIYLLEYQVEESKMVLSKKQASDHSQSQQETIWVKLEYVILIGLLLFISGLFVGSHYLRPSASSIAGSAASDSSAESGNSEILQATSSKQLIELGNRFYDRRQVDLAISAYTRAIQMEPNNPDVLTDLGTMYRERGLQTNNTSDLDRALEQYGAALKINPRHIYALYNTGVTASDRKNYTMAIAAWKRVLTIAPDSELAMEAKKRIQAAEAEVKKNPSPLK